MKRTFIVSFLVIFAAGLISCGTRDERPQAQPKVSAAQRTVEDRAVIASRVEIICMKHGIQSAELQSDLVNFVSKEEMLAPGADMDRWLARDYFGDVSAQVADIKGLSQKYKTSERILATFYSDYVVFRANLADKHRLDKK
jgi:hypothetical protein